MAKTTTPISNAQLATLAKSLSTIKPKVPFGKSEMLKAIQTLSADRQKTIVKALKAGGKTAVEAITSIMAGHTAGKVTEAERDKSIARTNAGSQNTSINNLRSILQDMYGTANDDTSSQSGSTTSPDNKKGINA